MMSLGKTVTLSALWLSLIGWWSGRLVERDIIPLVKIADAIDNALQKKSGATSAVTILSCLRQETFFMTEEGRSGVVFRHSGGIYRILATPL